MNKKVLIMCTGNSCRSIIGEALINKYLNEIDAYSCGVSPSGKVNPNAKRVLDDNLAWSNSYYSKDLDEVIDIDFDLVITVCDHAKESCPTFPKNVPIVHIGFIDPDGKDYSAFKESYKDIKDKLLPRVDAILRGDVANLAKEDNICYCIGVTKGEIEDSIKNGATTLKMIKDITKACTGSNCKESNPLKRCCSKEINQLIKLNQGDKMQKNLFKTNSGVKISFKGVVQKQQIVKMVENCATGNCECMSDDTKKKITNMQVEGKDGDVELNLSGDISKEEIEKALAKSKVFMNGDT